MVPSNEPNGIPTMLVTRWVPYECSTVSCPADFQVGYQRSLETKNMEEENKKNCEETEEEKAKREAEEAEAAKKAKKEAEEAEAAERAKREAEEAEAEAKAKREAAIAEIRSLGEITDNKNLAEDFIANNRSYEEFKEEVRKLKEEKLNVKEIKNMDNEKKEKFSLIKAMNMFTKNFKGNVEDTYEYKVIEENKRNLGLEGDIVVTRENLRAFPDGTEALNQTDYKPELYTENLRPESVIAKTGCRVVTVTGPSISFAVCTSGINAGFVDLNGEIPSADMNWGLKTLNPLKAGAFTQISYAALLQDRPSVENLVVDDLVRGLDQVIDEKIIVGDGTNNTPVGVAATSGVNEVPVSSAFTLSGVYEMEKKIRDTNDMSENLKWVMNSKSYYKYASTPFSATAQNEFLIDVKTRKMIGYDVVICNALNDNTIILGNFNELLVAQWDGITLKIVEDAQLSRKQALECQSFAAVNCLVRRPGSFTKTVA